MPVFDAAKRLVRRYWWAVLAAAGALAVVLWRVFGPRGEPTPYSPLSKPMPSLIDQARQNVERVHLEGEVEKAKTRAEADSHNEQISAIAKKGKTDPVAARKELAAYLAANL